MEIDELDNALDELEVRLERLRALYEQYFLGIEKLEPTIPRKDVDRRIYVLRREKIRNTGRRFKLQTLIQRYNTFQQYWQRVCREIENGTYRRHVLRAERSMGPSELMTVAARRRFGKERTLGAEPSAEAPAPTPAPPARPESLPPPRLETPTLPRGERAPLLPPLAAPALPRDFVAAASLTQPQAPPPSASFNGSFSEPAAPKPSAARPVAPERERLPPSMRPAKSVPPKAYESLELDMDFMGDWDPERAPQAAAPTASRSERSVKERAAPPPKPARRQQRSTNPGLAPPPPGTPRPAGEVPPPARATAPADVPAPRVAVETRGAAAPPAVAPPPVAVPRVAAAPPVAGPPPAAPVAATTAAAPPPAAALPQAAAEKARPATDQTKPAAQPRQRVRPGGATPAQANGGHGTLSEDRVRALHDRFLEETKKTNHPAVSLEGLARSVRAAEAKLRAQHGNRRIDFEVIVKDGKPILKPVVR